MQNVIAGPAQGHIPQGFLDAVSGRVFPDAAAIDGFFAGLGPHPGFIAWFNATRNARAWAGKSIPATAACAARFRQFWDDGGQVFGAPPDLLHFLCLMSIMVNEVGGDLLPAEERVNTPQGNPPGLAYAFNAIAGLKRSYNTLAGNLPAGHLFNDPDYLAAHGAKPRPDNFDPADPAWNGETWPGAVAANPDPAVSGFLLEADFFKFRGRGLIQTTTRANYLQLIRYVQAYTGTDPAVLALQTAWAGGDPATLATTSSNDDWHKLFFGQTLDIARQAIVIHNAGSGNYLALASNDAARLNGTLAGSVYNMGHRISGSGSYALSFQARIFTLCESIGAALAVA